MHALFKKKKMLSCSWFRVISQSSFHNLIVHWFRFCKHIYCNHSPVYNYCSKQSNFCCSWLLNRLHRTWGADGYWSSIQWISGDSVQSSLSDFRTKRSVQRSQQETGQEYLTLSYSTVTLLSSQACSEMPWMANTQVTFRFIMSNSLQTIVCRVW